MNREDVQIGGRYWWGDEECGLAVTIDDEIDEDHFVGHHFLGPIDEAISAEHLSPMAVVNV